MSQLKYRIYPSILDAYRDMCNAPEIWEKYWGNSDTPKISLEEYLAKSEQDFLDRVNRVDGEPCEPASKGTAFNEVVDCIIHHRQSDSVAISRINDAEGNITGVHAELDGFSFDFPIGIVMDFVGMYAGAQSQVLVSAVLPTSYGDVELYGYIDELMPFSVHDIKTTGRYEPFKFKHHAQHLVYTYCLQQNGCDVKRFEYNVTDFADIYNEVYTFERERDIPRLRAWVEELIMWLEANRERITDKKIFNEL